MVALSAWQLFHYLKEPGDRDIMVGVWRLRVTLSVIVGAAHVYVMEMGTSASSNSTVSSILVFV